MFNLSKQKLLDGFIAILCILNTFLRLPFLGMAAFRDEIVYVHRVLDLAKSTLNPFVNSWGYKPPATHIVPALFTYVFFPSQIWGRIEMYILSSITIYYTYKFGTKFFSRKIGVLATILLFFYPRFMAQSFIFQDAIPFTAFFLVTLYYYFSERKIVYTIAATLLVMTKETGVLLTGVLFLYEVFILYRKDKLQSSVNSFDLLYFLIPNAIFILWAVLNKFILGWFFWPDYVSQFNIHNIMLSAANGTLVRDILEIFFDYFFWPVTLVFLLSPVISKNYIRGISNSTKKIIYIFSVIFYIYTIFHLFGQVGPRYFLFLVPMMCIIFSYVADHYFPHITYHIVGTIIIGFICANISYTLFFPPKADTESSMEFLRTLELAQKTIEEIRSKYSNPYILSSGPFLRDQLSEPIFGFVKTPVGNQEFSCDDIVNKNRIKTLSSEHPNENILFVIVPNNPECSNFKKLTFLKSFCLYQNNEGEYCYHITKIPEMDKEKYSL